MVNFLKPEFAQAIVQYFGTLSWTRTRCACALKSESHPRFPASEKKKAIHRFLACLYSTESFAQI